MILPVQLPQLCFHCARCGGEADFENAVSASMWDMVNKRWVDVVIHADRAECERELS